MRPNPYVLFYVAVYALAAVVIFALRFLGVVS